MSELAGNKQLAAGIFAFALAKIEKINGDRYSDKNAGGNPRKDIIASESGDGRQDAESKINAEKDEGDGGFDTNNVENS